MVFCAEFACNSGVALLKTTATILPENIFHDRKAFDLAKLYENNLILCWFFKNLISFEISNEGMISSHFFLFLARWKKITFISLFYDKLTLSLFQKRYYNTNTWHFSRFASYHLTFSVKTVRYKKSLATILDRLPSENKTIQNGLDRKFLVKRAGAVTVHSLFRRTVVEI